MRRACWEASRTALGHHGATPAAGQGLPLRLLPLPLPALPALPKPVVGKRRQGIGELWRPAPARVGVGRRRPPGGLAVARCVCACDMPLLPITPRLTPRSLPGCLVRSIECESNRTHPHPHPHPTPAHHRAARAGARPRGDPDAREGAAAPALAYLRAAGAAGGGGQVAGAGLCLGSDGAGGTRDVQAAE